VQLSYLYYIAIFLNDSCINNVIRFDRKSVPQPHTYSLEVCNVSTAQTSYFWEWIFFARKGEDKMTIM